MKLWQKGEPINSLFERFTIGKDPFLDLSLAKYDVIASLAHVQMLGKIGLITREESASLIDSLNEIGQLIETGTFSIEPGIEDCHSQIEMILTEKLGAAGKKVHSGRSRNDQVVTALKLYTKAEIQLIARLVHDFFQLLIQKSEATKAVMMPGYTHMQVAMPSSFGLWFAAHAEALVDDLELLKAAFMIADKNPLGSAAGYGSSFPLERDLTTKLAGFSDMNTNSIYAQMTRGKTEKTTAFAISALAATIGKYAMDVCLYAGQDFGFFNIERSFTTGSSIMPHKHNPDGFELVRARCNQMQALPNQISMVLTNLPTGYHRDLQVLKELYIPAIETMKDCLLMITAMTEKLQVNESLSDLPKYEMLYTVETVNELVLKGIPFRDAYRQVAEQIKSGSFVPNKNLNHTHTGSIGNLRNDLIEIEFKKVFSFFTQSKAKDKPHRP